MFWNNGNDRFACAYILTVSSTYFYVFWFTPFFSLVVVMSFMYVRIFYVAALQEAMMLKDLEFQQKFQNSTNYQRIKRDRKYSKVW